MSAGHHLEPHACPSCATLLDGALAPLDPSAFPEPGDVTVCAYCAAVSRFVRGETGGPALELALVPDGDEVLEHPDLVRARDVVLRSLGR